MMAGPASIPTGAPAVAGIAATGSAQPSSPPARVLMNDIVCSGAACSFFTDVCLVAASPA